MARLRLFSKADKRAMKKLHDETRPSPLDLEKAKSILNPLNKIEAEKQSCPNCNAGWFNGVHCYDCNSNF